MSNKIYNKPKDTWIRPWMTKEFDDLSNRDERFFSIVIKGALNWLTRNIILYNKPIKHFIFNTGSAYLYIEQNGYNFSWKETSGEDIMYMELPRCVVELGDLSIPTEELTQPFVRSVYERKSGNEIKGYNAETRRLPLEMSLTLKYYLSNFNESIILLQEILDKIIFQRYFSVVYLGQTVECSIEFPTSHHIEINKIDMTESAVNQKNINIEVKLCTNYPIINERTEVSNDYVISTVNTNINTVINNNITDSENLIIE